MSENNRNKRLSSFETYAQAIAKILNLIYTIDQLSQYYDLNQISTQYLNEPFTPISPKKVANYFGVQYNKIPNLVQQTQYNPVVLVTKETKLQNKLHSNQMY